MLADRPLYLKWERQGKIWWNKEWLDEHGPVRQRIPDFDDHVSFANHDLKLNTLPLIQQTTSGRPFVNCLTPMTLNEIAQARALFAMRTSTPWQVEEFLKQRVFYRLSQVASILDVSEHHGFSVAEHTPGLDYLNSIIPRQKLRKVDWNRS